MTRIEIEYGDRRYSVRDAALEDLRAEIATGVAGGSHWLRVDADDARSTYLLITPGVPLVLIPVPSVRARDSDDDPRAGVPAFYEFDGSSS